MEFVISTIMESLEKQIGTLWHNNDQRLQRFWHQISMKIYNMEDRYVFISKEDYIRNCRIFLETAIRSMPEFRTI